LSHTSEAKDQDCHLDLDDIQKAYRVLHSLVHNQWATLPEEAHNKMLIAEEANLVRNFAQCSGGRSLIADNYCKSLQAIPELLEKLERLPGAEQETRAEARETLHELYQQVKAPLQVMDT